MMSKTEIRAQFDWVVRAGMIEPAVADECADNISMIGTLCERGVLTLRLADHLIETMAERAAGQWLAQYETSGPVH